ncbi:MAM domain-containing protein 2 [Hoplias malabaricus]|uniref:MAM domain-containing protein 2 n=1 Tax=Hoplias malabaricus TaxID=27720 RepID=UPI0034637197
MMNYLLLCLFVAVQADPLPGSCSFEGSTCDYTVDPAGLSWTFDPTGHFIMVDASSQEMQKDRAVLEGPEVLHQDWSCLMVVYQLTGSASLQIQRRSEGESFDHMLWSAHSPSDSWLIASIDLQNCSEPYKVVIEGRLGSDEDSSVAIFEVNISDKYCIACDFEEPHLCGYNNQWNSNVNWYLGNEVPNERTHREQPGHLMYVDSGHTKTLKEVAKLVSPMTTVPMSGCLSFQYQQDYVEGHLFSVYSRDRAGQYQELWRNDLPENRRMDRGDETQVWILVQVALRAPYPVEVVFEAAFNSPKGGRLLLDDISFSPEFCSSGTEPIFDPKVANCDFELGFCQYSQNSADSEMWRRVSVKPNIYRSGDHTIGTGSFLLANSHFTLLSGYVSQLFGPPLPGNQKYCLRFFYSLRGFSKTDQALAVYLYDTAGAKRDKIWTQSDKTRDIWIKVELTIQSQTTFRVVFISTCKNFWTCGSVGLDDISVSLGDCDLHLGTPALPSQCDFEAGLCGYIQDKEEDEADWVLIRGPTPTSYTGPKGDHTTGVGHYLHIEASLMLVGHKASLVSSVLRGSRGTQCLLFFYHMYGSGIGQLRVLLRSETQETDQLLWVRSGEQGMSWLRASVSYKFEHQHQIVFEATRGPSVRSDIAIDDIIFQKGPCRDSDQQISQFSLSGDQNDIE